VLVSNGLICGGSYSPLRSILRRSPPVNSGTHRSDYIDKVLDDVQLLLAFFRNYNLSALGLQSSFDVFDTEPRKTIPMLNDKTPNCGVQQQPDQVFTTTIQPRTYLCYNLYIRPTTPYRQGAKPIRLPLAIVFLI
jgi:hypothetical protein